MSDEYKNSFRGYLIDHHSPDPPVITFDNLDPKEYEEIFKNAHLDMIMVYCKDHFGSAYYPTKIGRMHPALKIDYVAAMKDVCQRNDMEFMAYYSVGFDNFMAIRHPDWALRDEYGNVERIKKGGMPPQQPPKWRWVCGNTPYRVYVLAQLEEIIKNYMPDTIFLDIFEFPLCYCKHCQKKYRSKYKRPLPKGKEKGKFWKELQDFRYQNYYDFAKAMTNRIRAIDKKVAITVNGGFSTFKKEMLDLFDYTYAEPSFGGTYLASAFARGTGNCPQIGPGTVSNVYDPQPFSCFILQSSYIVSQGCRSFMFCGSQHTDGSLDRLEFEHLCAAYKEIEKYQPYLMNRAAIKEVGIVYSENSRLYEKDYSYGSTYEDSICGAIEAVSYSKHPFEVIPEWNLSRQELKDYKILLLSNMSCMSREIAEIIKDYVQNGGILISTQKTSLCDERGKASNNFQFADVFGCNFLKINKKYMTNPWGSFLDKSSHPIWENLPDTELAVSAPYVEAEAAAGEVIARHILPCVKLTTNSWVNWWSPPWQKYTNLPAVVINSYGKGKSLYISFDLFGMIRRTIAPFLWPKDFIARLFEYLLPKSNIIVKDISRHGVGVTYFHRKDGSIVVHELNHTVEYLKGEVVPIGGGKLTILESYLTPKQAKQIYPEEKEIEIIKQKGVFYVDLPKIQIHNIFLIK